MTWMIWGTAFRETPIRNNPCSRFLDMVFYSMNIELYTQYPKKIWLIRQKMNSVFVLSKYDHNLKPIAMS